MMSPRIVISPRYSSAGGQDEQPCEVKSSTTTGEPARAGDVAATHATSVNATIAASGRRPARPCFRSISGGAFDPWDESHRTSRGRPAPVTRHHVVVTRPRTTARGATPRLLRLRHQLAQEAFVQAGLLRPVRPFALGDEAGARIRLDEVERAVVKGVEPGAMGDRDHGRADELLDEPVRQ